MDAIAIVVEDGVQVQQGLDRFGPTLLNRKRGSQMMQPREAATVIVNSSAFDFFWRMIARVGAYLTRIRRFFVLTLAKDGNHPQVKDSERGVIKVEEGLVEASGAGEPQLAAIIVSEKATTPARAESKTVDLQPEDCGSDCTRRITADEQPRIRNGDNPTLCADDNHGAACQIDEKPANSAACEPDMTCPPELKDGHCTAADAQHDKCHNPELDASYEEELRNRLSTIEAPSPTSCDSKLETPVEESALEPPKQIPSPKHAKSKSSIHQLNAMVAEQLTKYLQALERSIVPSTLNQNTTHRRAIILATLFAIVVWARNSKHLHESMPCIKGSTINVHIRSRL